jgi:3-deoxy-D-manno-octulosonate 8-phosphate phosphatase (KDO 8-P phosphatase)
MTRIKDAEARARNIKVLAFEVDGVLRDGWLTFIPKLDGAAAETKGFSVHDGLGISLAAQGSLERVIAQYLDADEPTARSGDIGTGKM